MIVLMKGLNEEFAVKRVISDFHDENWVEKIIVIDGGSTDYTVQELKAFPKVEVYIHPWLDWYHNMEVSQSNIALSYVPNGSLAFILDFDERISPELKNELSRINEIGFETDVGHVSRKTIDVIRYPDSPIAVLGEDGWPLESNQIGQFPDYQCRLIQKNPHLHWINSPHHVIDGIQSNTNLPVECPVIHYEKDDYRIRTRIEKKWLRAQARRKELGLTADVFECKPKIEIAEYSDIGTWK